MAIKFNSISQTLFNANAAEFQNVEKERADIVTCGRLLMMEHSGRGANTLRKLEKQPEEYTPVLNGAPGKGYNYADTNRSLQQKMLLYAAKRSCAVSGEIPPADFKELQTNQRKFMTDGTFLKVLSGVIRDVVTPMLPITMSNALSWLAETVPVPLGQTYELDVQSNDVFLFEDDSWGASRSKPSNYLYSHAITLNPTLRTAKATIKWSQLMGNDADMGAFFNSIAAGMYSKITALWTKAMVAATNDSFFTPDNLRFTNTSANWVTAAKRVAAANGSKYWNVVGYGHPSALTKALPSGVVNASTVNLDAALATMLGVDWARYGFLGEYMGVRLMPVDNAIVPGTQNTTITEIIPQDKIWLFPMSGYRPVYVGIEEGTPITVELDPGQTADMTIDISVSISLDCTPVFASKGAVITV